MTGKTTYPGATADPSTVQPPHRGRDVREDAQDDTEEPSDKGTPVPPEYNDPTHGVGRFLLKACDADTPLDELADRYREWRGGDQSTLEGYTDA